MKIKKNAIQVVSLNWEMEYLVRSLSQINSLATRFANGVFKIYVILIAISIEIFFFCTKKKKIITDNERKLINEKFREARAWFITNIWVFLNKNLVDSTIRKFVTKKT